MKEPDHRDLALEMLADSEASLRADVAAYRALALAALEQLHGLTDQHARLCASHRRLLDEYRHLRAHMMRVEAAA